MAHTISAALCAALVGTVGSHLYAQQHPTDPGAVLLDSIRVTAIVTVPESEAESRELSPTISGRRVKIEETVFVWATSGRVDLVGGGTIACTALDVMTARPSAADLFPALSNAAVDSALARGLPGGTQSTLTVHQSSSVEAIGTTTSWTYGACAGGYLVRTYQIISGRVLVGAPTCGGIASTGCECTAE